MGRGTVANVLRANGIEPAPERGKHTRWSTFLKAHWKILAASDFFTVEVWISRGLMTYYVLHTSGRRLRAAGVPFETRQVLLGHTNGSITTHYSAVEIGELIAVARFV